MYNQQFFNFGREQIETQIREMPSTFTSTEFLSRFEASFPAIYEDFIRIYMSWDDALDRPHAIQIVHSQLMHTVNDRFHSLARKVQTIRNPKGGDMSEWTRV